MKTFLSGRAIAFSCIGLISFVSQALAQQTGEPGQPAKAPLSARAFVPRLHDPSSIVKCRDEYWLFSTGMGIPSRRSKDLVNWREGPPVFANPSARTTNLVPGNRGYFWAPDVIQFPDRYLLYDSPYIRQR